ncbi:conserved hypothetical protein [Brevundimonas subvibrioides ATCC 15264]|uniref:Uncharacterized protein n=1 Tax=Brevundimonas subvibrioides (strain ATCC 15264 / DSM 4735 / LMG 14903 / NBRC 16000 / CB 81) TaxID=633149 RepID=D9QI72_BRESC|nr:conserved hypothetical protein [Brevundimonas subvibrioides ATCC 15264]
MVGSIGQIGRTIGGVGLSAPAKGGGAPAGYGFLRIGSASSNQLVRVGSDSSAPRIVIPTGA